MVKQGIVLSMVMLAYTVFSIAVIFVYGGELTNPNASIYHIISFGIIAFLMVFVPFGEKETNIYWKLLGLSLFTYTLSFTSNFFINNFLLLMRLLLESLSFYGFYARKVQ